MNVLIVIYCVMLHGLLLCCCCCDCVFPLHVLVRLFVFCVLLYGSCLHCVLLWLNVFFFVFTMFVCFACGLLRDVVCFVCVCVSSLWIVVCACV